MEKKRKLPARAAARSEQAAKRRTLTPPERRSATPPPLPDPESEPAPEAPVPLPTSIQAGKPLPTTEEPQPEDLPAKDYRSVAASGVLSESLSRSRRTWISEGIFEKYWTKPYKKKGVLVEEPNNPPKDSMTKVGHQITITVEPHVFDVTMYTVKDPKPPVPSAVTDVSRPVMQYGPPNGVMPPLPQPSAPVTPSTLDAVPARLSTQAVGQVSKTSPSEPSTPMQSLAQTQSQPSQPFTQPVQNQQPLLTPSYTLPPQGGPHAAPVPPLTTPGPTSATQMMRPIPSPRGMESILSPSTATPQPAPSSVVTAMSTSIPQNGAPPAPFVPLGPAKPPGVPPQVANPPSRPGAHGAPNTGTAAKPAPGTDPIILTLAEKAGQNPELRDLMKRVAQGDASKPELERFQLIIDEITAESKRRGTPGPSPDRLLVEGKTVRYFAEEVRQILDIVWASNPKQESSTLRPPEGSDPLVVKLVKKSLDDSRTRDLVTRVAEKRTQFADATDLKAVLDMLKREIVRDMERLKKESPASSGVSTPTTKSHDFPNAHGPAAMNHGAVITQQAPQQLRSKGPPPPQVKPLPDISAVVFEFAGGNGDRYLFPKFSILEYVPSAQGQQVIASFLIVRKGSASEYPVADPALDYYQPVTIRLYTPTGRHLDYLSRVVAPEDEVRRYMNDVMDKMTRAEYILLAMRLPRPETAKEQADAAAGSVEDSDALDKDKGNRWNKQSGLRWINHTTSSGDTTATPASAPMTTVAPAAMPPTALWTTRPLKPEIRELPPRSKMYPKEALEAMDTDDQYQSFIASVSRKELPEEA